MVSSVEDFLLEYDYKISLSVDQSSASEEEGVGDKAGPRAGGWEIVILEVSFKIDSALREARRVLRPGGRFLCLEFSKVITKLL